MNKINDSIKDIENSKIEIVNGNKISYYYGINYEVPKILTANLGMHLNFIGRVKELKELDMRLSESNSLLLINGIGGIGKSSLASYYLNIKKDEFSYYGFVEVGDNIISTFILNFKTSLNIHSQEYDKVFSEIILKLRNLNGNKLLVIDNIKNIGKQQKEIELISSLIYNYIYFKNKIRCYGNYVYWCFI